MLEAFGRHLRREDAGLRDITDMHVLKEVVAALGFVEGNTINGLAQQRFQVALHELPRTINPAGTQRDHIDPV
ncbi:hypothetical protein D9M70_611730 [compost metagenome]